MYQFARVITPPANRNLTTVAAISSEIDTTAGNASRIPSLIAQASRMIERYIGKSLARQQISETFVWEAGDNVSPSYSLSYSPLISIDGLLDQDGNVWTTYDFDPNGGILYTNGYATRLTVLYTFGFLLPGDPARTLPEDIERACIDTVLTLWFRPDRGDPSIKSDHVEGVGSTSYYDNADVSGLPATAIGLLADLRAAR